MDSDSYRVGRSKRTEKACAVIPMLPTCGAFRAEVIAVSFNRLSRHPSVRPGREPLAKSLEWKLGRFVPPADFLSAMRKPAIWLVYVAIAGGCLAADAFRAPSGRELRLIFKPARVDQVTLSPDGRHFAYTVREAPRLNLVITDLDRPAARITVPVGADRWADLGKRGMLVEARVTFLRWATPNRLIFATSVAPEKDGMGLTREEVHAIDDDGRNPATLVSPHDIEELVWPENPDDDSPPQPIQRRPRVLGIDPTDAEFLFVEAIGGRAAASELYRINVRTGDRRSLYTEEESGRVSYDQQGRPRFLRMAAGGGSTTPSLTYRDATDRARWRDFDQAIGPDAALSFATTAPNAHRERAFPLAFDANPNLLYFASNAGRDTYGLYALDLQTRRRTNFAVEVPEFDVVDVEEILSGSPLIFDRARHVVGVRLPGLQGGTRWLDPALAQQQAELDGVFRDRLVEIIEWDDARGRFLVLVSNHNDPGRYFIFRPGRMDSMTEVIRRAPWLTADSLPETHPFAFDTPAGIHLTGTLTLPVAAHTSPPPTLVYCRDLPGRRPRVAMNREIHALARLGFAVVQVNYRGSAGLGTRHREATRSAPDRIPLEDIRATVAWLATQPSIDSRHVALIGHGFGGYLGARAVQLYPEEFRCAVMIDSLADRSLLPTVGQFHRPVFMLEDEARRDFDPSPGRRLREALKKRGLKVEYLALPEEFSAGEPDACAKAFASIGDFVNETIFDSGVSRRETKEQP